MNYYKHRTDPIVYEMPEPIVSETTHKRKHSGWSISSSVTITDARNSLDTKTGKWKNPTYYPALKKYEAKDSRNDALSDFHRTFPSEPYIKIEKEEYYSLKAEYEKQAREI